MERFEVDVAVVGAGTAGLFALARAAASTENVILFEGGAQGTMCARVGCMPSKALIHMARRVHAQRSGAMPGIPACAPGDIDFAQIMAHVRKARDFLASRVVERTGTRFGDRVVPEYARFAAPMVLTAGGVQYHCKKIVLATGSSPVVPPGWRLVSGRIVTTDSFFDLERLPRSALVVGMGPVGIELGQALARMGLSVTAVEMGTGVAGIQDAAVMDLFKQILSEDMEWHTTTTASLVEVQDAVTVVLKELETGDETVQDFGLVLLASGRRPNLANVGIENAGIVLDERGFPRCDPRTLRCEGQDVFLAGDASGLRPFYHDAVDQGILAGRNAGGGDGLLTLAPKVPLTVVFTHPNVCSVGKRAGECDPEKTVVGEARYDASGRGFLESSRKGIVRLYAHGDTHRVLGAEMAADQGEHLAHLLAAVIHTGQTVQQALELPYYHPTYEEAVQAALEDCRKKLG